jgi:hypothetical protein
MKSSGYVLSSVISFQIYTTCVFADFGAWRFFPFPPEKTGLFPLNIREFLMVLG